MEAKHTPTPWARNKYGKIVNAAGESIVVSSFSLSCGPRDREAEANDDLIFRAVNSHPMLVDVAKLALKTILDEAEARNYEPPANGLLVAELEAAIAAAEAA